MTTGFLEVERRALAEVWARKKLAVTLLLGNALLAVAAYAWLWVPDETVIEVGLSMLLALAVVLAVVWLNGAALAAFHTEAGPLPLRLALRRLPRFLLWVVVVAAITVAAAWLAGSAGKISQYLASWLTLRLRRPVSPERVEWLYGSLLRGAWCAAVLALVPLASQAAGGGFSARAALRTIARPRYWLACALLALAGLYVPGKLVSWTPEFGALSFQAGSIGLRLGLAYLLAVTAWLVLAAVIGRMGREGQKP